jgi:hypothetical protein
MLEVASRRGCSQSPISIHDGTGTYSQRLTAPVLEQPFSVAAHVALPSDGSRHRQYEQGMLGGGADPVKQGPIQKLGYSSMLPPIHKLTLMNILPTGTQQRQDA